MRILHLIPTLGKGGAERLVVDICKQLVQLNHTVKLVIMHSVVDNPAEIVGLDWQVLNAKRKIIQHRNSAQSLRNWKNLLDDFQPDVIHTHLFEAEFLGHSIIRENTVYVSHLHDNMFQFQPFPFKQWRKSNMLQWLEKMCLIRDYLKCNNQFVAISNDTATFFKKHLPQRLHKNIHLIPNAVKASRFLCKDLRIPSSFPIRAVNIGSFVEKKNQIFLLDVLAILIKNGIDIHLDFLGDGALLKTVQKKALALGLEKQVHFRGKVNNVEDYLKKAHFYLHAATYEPFGLVLLEGMLAGCLCISLNGKGNIDLHEEGKNGVLIDPPSATNYANAIMHFLNNPSAYETMVRYAQTFALKYDIRPYTEKLLNLYQYKH